MACLLYLDMQVKKIPQKSLGDTQNKTTTIMNTVKNLLSLLLVTAALSTAPAMAAEKEKEDVKPSKNTSAEVEVDPFYYVDNPSEPATLEFYDFDDNLVYSVTVTKDCGANPDLAKYLNESDFLVQLGSTSYFRMNN